MWVTDKNSNETSIDKFNKIIKLCENIGVYTKPMLIESSVWIIPLFSWYEVNFRKEDGDIYIQELKNSMLNGWSDFMLCKWPSFVTDNIVLPKLNGESILI